MTKNWIHHCSFFSLCGCAGVSFLGVGFSTLYHLLITTTAGEIPRIVSTTLIFTVILGISKGRGIMGVGKTVYIYITFMSYVQLLFTG